MYATSKHWRRLNEGYRVAAVGALQRSGFRLGASLRSRLMGFACPGHRLLGAAAGLRPPWGASGSGPADDAQCATMPQG